MRSVLAVAASLLPARSARLVLQSVWLKCPRVRARSMPHSIVLVLVCVARSKQYTLLRSNFTLGTANAIRNASSKQRSKQELMQFTLFF